MRILFFVQSLEGGGAERVICNLSDYLVARNHKVTILTLYNHGVAYKLNNKITVVCASFAPQLFKTKIRSWWQMIKTIKGSDVCVSFLSTPILLTLLLRPFLKIKLICTERNYPPSRYGERLQYRLKKWAKRADAWVFQTNQQRDWYGESVADIKAHVIPNAINSEFLKEKTESTMRDKVIVTVGSLQEKKNHKLLIEAFSTLTNKYPDYKLVIYGDGELRESLVGLIRELNIENKVELPGFVDNINARISKASLFVLSSNVEGIPNALIEAMALGLPCVSTRCAGGGAEFLIEDGVNGLLVPVNDVVALANAMEKVLTDKEFANKLGNNAFKLRETLAPEIIYEKWLNVIESVIKKR